jgi:hypothetical protein
MTLIEGLIMVVLEVVFDSGISYSCHMGRLLCPGTMYRFVSHGLMGIQPT